MSGGVVGECWEVSGSVGDFDGGKRFSGLGGGDWEGLFGFFYLSYPQE